MLSKIALLAVNTEDFDNQMNEILQIIGQYTRSQELIYLSMMRMVNPLAINLNGATMG